MTIGVYDLRGVLSNALLKTYSEFDSLNINDNVSSYDKVIFTGTTISTHSLNVHLINDWSLFRQVIQNSKRGCSVIYVSSDHVFDGRKGMYGEKNETRPVTPFGFNKLASEQLMIKKNIIRTSMVFGYYGCFVSDLLRRMLNTEDDIYITNALDVSPIYISHLVKAIKYVSEMEDEIDGGILNVAGNSVLSLYEFALNIAEVFELDKQRIIPTQQIKFNDVIQPRKLGLRTFMAEELGVPIYPVFKGLEDMKNDV